MIRYTLRCGKGHGFDSWFQSAEAYESLRASGHVACAVCGDTSVEKAVMAPQVRPARNAAVRAEPAVPGPLSGPKSAAEQAFAELRAKIEAETEDVGNRFANEARAIHHGEAPERAIRGQARHDEARSLIDEGIAVAPLPFGPRKTN